MDMAKIKDGWVVCSECGKKLAKITEHGIEIKCRNSKCATKNTVILSKTDIARIIQQDEKSC